MTPNTDPNTDGLNPLGPALEKAQQEAAAAGRPLHAASTPVVEPEVVSDAAFKAASDAAQPVNAKKPNAATRAFVGGLSAIERFNTAVANFFAAIWRFIKLFSLVSAVIGVLATLYFVANVETKKTLSLHGDLHEAGFFSNLGFKLDTDKKTTIHQRGGNIEAITLRDSKNRLYVPFKNGWKKLGD